MSSDFLYSCVMDVGWFFLAGWLLVLLGAGIQAFRLDLTKAPQLAQPFRTSR
jgi:hypothetical protein